MIPDITLRDYYYLYIDDAKKKLKEYKDKLKTLIAKKYDVYKYIEDNKNFIKDTFTIDLDTFEEEFINKKYNPNEKLYRICNLKLHNIGGDNYRHYIIQLLNYCNILREENSLLNTIDEYTIKSTMKFNKYRQYVNTYYSKVHQIVLEGNGYKFCFGIGTYCINYWKLDNARMKKKLVLDYAETNKKKKELLAKGIKLYDEKEAAWYEARGIPYNAVDYRVFRKDNFFYDITIIKSKLFTSKTLDYKHTEYIAGKYRGMSYRDIADKVCKTKEEVYNLQVDIKYKLNILLYKDPMLYLNFIRNAEQCKYKRGAHNS